MKHTPFTSFASATDEYLYSSCQACRAGRAYMGLGALALFFVTALGALLVYSVGYFAVAVLGLGAGWLVRHHAFGLSRAYRRKRRRDQAAQQSELVKFLAERGV